MPIYEYICGDCQKEFDLLVFKLDEADKQSCPECGATNLQRKISAIASMGECQCGSCKCSPSTKLH